MHGRRLRHIAGVLVVTVASGLLFSVSALNERKNPAATSDLSTLVRNRQEQVKSLENEVAALDAQIQSFTTTAPQSGDEDVFTIGPLIHNPRVVAQLKDHGVESIEGPADVDHGIVVLRTHGVEPSVVEELDERGLSSIDATCPHVSRAQKAAADFAAQGMTVLVIGRASHPEVRGICAHAAGSAVVVADASEIPADIAGPVGIVVQTTENKSKLDEVVADLRGRGLRVETGRFGAMMEVSLVNDGPFTVLVEA
mgnify:CR=1 FL=1